jgi:hypothetical protein
MQESLIRRFPSEAALRRPPNAEFGYRGGHLFRKYEAEVQRAFRYTPLPKTVEQHRDDSLSAAAGNLQAAGVEFRFPSGTPFWGIRFPL